jgi:hypothetical protein
VSRGERAKFPGHQVLAAEGRGGTFCGLAVEVGEEGSQGSFAGFKEEALAEVDATKLEEGIAQVRGAGGRRLRIEWSDDPRRLGVWRDGVRHDWEDHARYLYRPAPAGAGHPSGPIFAEWGKGELLVEAGGERFRCSVTEDGKVTFRNEGGAR